MIKRPDLPGGYSGLDYDLFPLSHSSINGSRRWGQADGADGYGSFFYSLLIIPDSLFYLLSAFYYIDSRVRRSIYSNFIIPEGINEKICIKINKNSQQVTSTTIHWQDYMKTIMKQRSFRCLHYVIKNYYGNHPKL